MAACWGLAGGMCVEGLELYATIRRTPKWNWRKPIPQGLLPYLLSVTIRAGLSAVVVAAATASGQVISAFSALGLGVAAPLIIEKLARAVPVTQPAPTLDEVSPSSVIGFTEGAPTEVGEVVDAG